MSVFFESKTFDYSREFISHGNPPQKTTIKSKQTIPAFLLQKIVNVVLGILLCIYLAPTSPLVAVITWKSPFNILGMALGAYMVYDVSRSDTIPFLNCGGTDANQMSAPILPA